MKQYPKYKTIRGHWIRSIPSDWAMDPVKRNYDIQLGKMLQNRRESSDDREIQYFKAQHVQWHSIRRTNLPMMWVSPMEIIRYGVQNGDLLVCEGGEGGRCGLVHSFDGEAIIQNALHRVRSKGGNFNRYLEYSMRAISSIGWFDAINNKATIAHFTRDKFGKLLIPLPPPDEQAAIVQYLDHMTRRIDKAIRAKKKLIQLLNEQKQVIIHQAVTKGLDPNVPMKDSGVPWLGEVPEHWEVVRLKSIVTKVTSGSRGWSNYIADEGPLFIRIGNLTRGSIGLNLKDDARLNLPISALSEARRTGVRPLDILISITAYIGSIAVVPEDFEEAYISQHVACCSPMFDRADSKWVAYVLLSEVGQVYGQLSMYGGTKQGLSLNDVKNYIVFLPPKEEQLRLVDWIEQSVSQVANRLKTVEKQIALLQEYRTRLIADVVTGQIDVREIAAQLPDEQEDVEPFDLDDVEESIDEELITQEE